MLPAPLTPFDYNALPAATAETLRSHAARIRERVRATTAAIIEIGRDLKAIKHEHLDHGQFSAWVESECRFTLRSAENYIRAAEFAEGKNETVALLPPAAVYKLAAKSTPLALVQAVMERVESGTPVNIAEINAGLSEVRRRRHEAEREVKEAERRKKKSKQALAQEEARRRAEEVRLKHEEEKLRHKAVSLIDAVGEDHARLVVMALFTPQGWDVFEHMRREVAEREATRVKSEAKIAVAPTKEQSASVKLRAV